MEFKKFSSIENHYQAKFIDLFIARKPSLINMKYYIEEKIHGANFQLAISENDVEFGRRTGFITDDDKFYNSRTVIERDDCKDLIDKVQSKAGDSTVIIYGELCGLGVQKEVYYFDQQEFLVFDISIDGEYLSPKDVRVFMSEIGHSDKMVPLLAIVDSLVEALEFNVIFDSRVSLKEDNRAEGVVIKPEEPTFRGDGKRFVIKKKNPKFKENEDGRVKKPKTTFEPSPLQLAFSGYVNANRVSAVMSKQGEIENASQIGQYIKYVFEDAIEDFQKENEEYSDMCKDQRRECNKMMGKLTAPLIKDYLLSGYDGLK